MSRQLNPQRVAEASAMQALAADPRYHVWVSANAGTGKTEVLTRRILLLLLHDTTLPPRSIVALTYTREVAREMSIRLLERVAGWDTLDAALLDRQLAKLLGTAPTGSQLARARELALLLADEPVLTTTLHGFAQTVLSRFPLEAGVDPDFTVLDDPAQRVLLQQAFADAMTFDDADIQTALDTMVGAVADSSLENLSRELVSAWPRIRHVLAHHGGVQAACDDLYGVLGLASAVPQPSLNQHHNLLQAWADALAAYPTSNNVKQLARLHALLANPCPATWGNAFATGEFKPRAALATKDAERQLGAAATETLATLQHDVMAALRYQHSREAYTLSAAVLRWSTAMNAAYESLKATRGALDFNDLIAKLEELLHNTDRTWVHYRLDRNIRHLLLDEGQDNSPVQNRIFNLLATELLADAAGDTPRTVFAVGDIKQSIYRFQGAAPQRFIALSRHMAAANPPAFRDVPMTVSFRSASTVLQLANRVFSSGNLATTLLGHGMAWPVHVAAHDDAGRVEVWPLLATPKTATSKQGWEAPCAPPATDKGPFLLAQRLAEDIRARMARHEVFPSTGQPLRLDDVLVLAQRNATATQLAAGLRKAGIPARLFNDKGDPPALLDDCVAWLRVMANMHDRVALAQLLKSPLAGWSDADLLRLHHAAGEDWRNQLAAVHPATAEWIDTCQNRLRTNPLHDVLAWMLVERCVAERYSLTHNEVAALASPLLAMAMDAGGTTALVARLERDMPPATAGGDGHVRVMTVHKAKGLEAPLVYVAETTRTPTDGRPSLLLWDDDADGSPLRLAWRPPAKHRHGVLQDWELLEQQRLGADSLRSLYVALTRAKDMLVVCGWGQPKEASWYLHVTSALGLPATFDDIWADGATFATGTPPPPPPAPPAQAPWPLPPALVSSGNDADHARGLALHLLLEVLPSVAADQRTPMGLALLRSHGFSSAEPAAALVAEAIRVMDTLPDFFTGGRSEVVLAGGQRADRLVCLNGIWWLLDFKSDREPPASVPPAYIAQLRRYASTLAPVLGRLRLGLIWTATATLVEVDADGMLA